VQHLGQCRRLQHRGADLLLQRQQGTLAAGIDGAARVAWMGKPVGDQPVPRRMAAGGDRGRTDPGFGGKHRSGAGEPRAHGSEAQQVRGGLGPNHVGPQPVEHHQQERDRHMDSIDAARSYARAYGRIVARR
jgi:hypothetical protein